MSSQHNNYNDLLRSDKWSISDSFVASVDVLGQKIHLSGLEAKSTAGVPVVGSAASLELSPFDRSYYELLERISIVEALSKDSSSLFDEIDTSGKVINSLKASVLFGEESYMKASDYQISKSEYSLLIKGL